MNGESDALQIYLKEIGKIPVLSREDEEALAKKAKKGDEEARKELIKSNLKLVVTISRKYVNLGLSFSDLVEEGNLGLMRAVEKYDLRKGCKLSTYAAWWIKQSIIRALANQSNTIRLPVYIVEKISSIRKVSRELFQSHGHMPSVIEIASELGIAPEKVREFQTLATRPDSLQEMVADNGISELIDIIADADTSSPSREVAEKMLSEDVIEMMKILTEREVKILSWRFGLFGNIPKTLEKIGEEFDLTRERIRQILESSIKKLRNYLHSKDIGFHDYSR
ncbi:RNA polymerase sigma factor RpoD/SigA [Chlamydiota bacterium]